MSFCGNSNFTSKGADLNSLFFQCLMAVPHAHIPSTTFNCSRKTQAGIEREIERDTERQTERERERERA